MRKRFGWAALIAAVCWCGAACADTLVRDAKGNVIYQYSNGVMYQGLARDNKKIFRFDAGQGEIWSLDGKKLAFWKASEDTLYPGPGGRPMYVYADKGGHPGSKGAQAVIYIDGRKIYHGNGPGGTLILYPDAPLPTPVALYLAHTVTGGKAPAPSGLKVDFATIPYGYYLGPKGTGPLVLSLRGNVIYYGGDLKKIAYVVKQGKNGIGFFRDGKTEDAPAFFMANNGWLYRGGKADPANLLMKLEWFNCYAADKSGQDAIGTVQYVGENILTEGYTKPSQKPDFTGKRILLSSTLPNNRVPLGTRIFLVYLTQLDPDFRQYLQSVK